MNYSDLQQIQQDEWSLSRPTFVTPKGGILTVVGWSGKRGHNKCYIVECTECKKVMNLTEMQFTVLQKINLIEAKYLVVAVKASVGLKINTSFW